jgi:hypothetical protein
VNYFLLDNLTGEVSSRTEHTSKDFLVNSPGSAIAATSIFSQSKLEEYHKTILTSYNTKLNGRIIRPNLASYINFMNSWEIDFKRKHDIGSYAEPTLTYHENIVLNAN